MCLIVFNWQPGTSQWLTLSANRDEFYQRPTRALEEWSDAAGVYAGKDLEQGGTWLGVTESGNWAALTNVRAPGIGPSNPISRGELVLSFLSSNTSPEVWLAQVKADRYAPFNLLVGSRDELWYFSNFDADPNGEVSHIQQRLTPGQYSLSNASLNSPWPKAELALEQLTAQPKPSANELARLLNRREPWPDNDLPSTGVPIAWERLLSAQFIMAPGYGTRCSTGIVAKDNQFSVQEITWNESGKATENRSYNIVLKDR